MGTSRSADQLARKLYKTGRAIPTATRIATEQAALAGKETFLSAGRAAIGGDRLRGVGRGGAKWGVGYDVKGYQSAVARLRYRGPVHLVNNRTKAHEIEPKRKKAIHFGSQAFFSKVQHPGTPGKHFVGPAKQVVARQSPRIFARAFRRAALHSFQ